MEKEVSGISAGVMLPTSRKAWLNILRGVRLDDTDGLQYLERVLQSTGVIKALEDAGVQEGDTVSIYDFEFDFID